MSAKKPTSRPRYGLKLTLMTGLVALAASAGVPAWSQGMMGGPGMGGAFMDGGPHMGGPGMGGHGMLMGNPERLGRVVDHMLDGLNASAAQRNQIKQIVQAAATELKAQRDAGRALRDKGLQIFTAPTVDAAAVEALRQQMLAQHDQASKRITQAMLDIAKVLTPEQRAKIGERMKQRAEIMRERMQRAPDGPGHKP
jgi:Spy/CpxP family protein refolding chaperone